MKLFLVEQWLEDQSVGVQVLAAPSWEVLRGDLEKIVREGKGLSLQVAELVIPRRRGPLSVVRAWTLEGNHHELAGCDGVVSGAG